MDKKDHVLVNSGIGSDINSPKQHANLNFLDLEKYT